MRIPDRELLLVGAFVLAWLACTAWMRPLTRPDEGRYVGVAWEMLRSGHWLVPTLNGLPYFQKPPLFYWLTAAAMELLGPHVFAARLASILSASLVAVTLFAFARRRRGSAFAGWAALVLVTQPFFFLGAQFANHDMLVAACISVAVLLAAHAVLGAEKGSSRGTALTLSYSAMALGVLSKGLIGVVLPVAILLAWLAASRRLGLTRALLSWQGGLLFCAVVLPWLVLMEIRYPGFVRYFFVFNQFQRFTQGGFNNHHGLWFYPVAIVLLTLPWSLALPKAFCSWQALPSRRSHLCLSTLMWCWIGVVVVFFSIPQSKLYGYAMPALAPIAWLAAEAVEPLTARNRWRWHWHSIAGLASTLCVTAALGGALFAHHSTRHLAEAFAARQHGSDGVFYVGQYPFDFGVYARLDRPAYVVENWHDAAIPTHDGWRRELLDTAQFDPAGAAQWLLDDRQAASALCSHAVNWLLGPASAIRHEPWQRAFEIETNGELALWRLDRSMLPCSSKSEAAGRR